MLAVGRDEDCPGIPAGRDQALQPAVLRSRASPIPLRRARAEADVGDAVVGTVGDVERPAARTEARPWLATPVRGSMRTGVPELVPCGSPSRGGSPPQLLMYTFPGLSTQMVYGATPTGISSTTLPVVRSMRCTLLLRVAVTS